MAMLTRNDAFLTKATVATLLRLHPQVRRDQTGNKKTIRRFQHAGGNRILTARILQVVHDMPGPIHGNHVPIMLRLRPQEGRQPLHQHAL